MQCPNDQSVLVMSERGGVEIDYCPTCRGVWLDRGELDKILERAGAELRAAQDYRSPAVPAVPAAPVAAQSQPSWSEQQPAQAYGQQGYDQRGHDDRRYDDRARQQAGDQGYYRTKKRESWLSELFD